MLVNVLKEEATVINMEEHPDYMNYIDGDIFDIVCKRIGNKYYDMIYTDLGEILIFNSSAKSVSGLKENDIERINRHYCEIKTW